MSLEQQEKSGCKKPRQSGKQGFDMNTPTKFWVPRGVPDHLQVALSIPGDPPANPSEHMGRLESLLAELAKELEEWTEPGGALRAAQDFVPDTNLMYQPDDISFDTLAYVLMNSDQLQTAAILEADGGDYDEDLQDACREANFEERLAALVYLP